MAADRRENHCFSSNVSQ